MVPADGPIPTRPIPGNPLKVSGVVVGVMFCTPCSICRRVVGCVGRRRGLRMAVGE